MPTKQHIVLEAKATATDKGEFVAIAAAYSVDRVGDRIMRGAFSKTINHWRESGKSIPLHWNHQGEPEDIIGAVDPMTVEETKDGLRVAGKIDLSGTKAQEAWRAMKTGSMSLSFGYMVVSEKQAKDANELHELDLFEISVVPGPANADTRFLSLKSLPDLTSEEVGQVLLRGLREHSEQIAELQKRMDGMHRKAERPAHAATATEDEPPVEVAPEQTPVVTPQAADPEVTAIEKECIEALT